MDARGFSQVLRESRTRVPDLLVIYIKFRSAEQHALAVVHVYISAHQRPLRLPSASSAMTAWQSASDET